ncbi:MAG: hypothetical protein L3J51_12130 [Cocleimonas sp.]|nr:hypothetical protein [Cocleimonas sp.]
MKVNNNDLKQMQLPLKNLKESKSSYLNNSNNNIVCFNTAKTIKQNNSNPSAISRILESAEKLTW